MNRRAFLKGLAGGAATTAFEGVASAAAREDELVPPSSEIEALNGEQIRERLMRIRDLYLETRTAVDPREIFRVLRRLPFLASEELPFFQVSDHITEAEKNARYSLDPTKPVKRKDLLTENFQRAQEVGELKLSGNLSLVAVGDFSYTSIPHAIAFYDPRKRAIVFNQEKDRASKQKVFNDKLWRKVASDFDMTNRMKDLDEEKERFREELSTDALFQEGLQRFLEEARHQPGNSEDWDRRKPELIEEYTHETWRQRKDFVYKRVASEQFRSLIAESVLLEDIPAQMLMEVYEQQLDSEGVTHPTSESGLAESSAVMHGLKVGGDIISQMEDFVRSEIKHERFTRFSVTHEAFHYFFDQYIQRHEKPGYEGPAMKQLLFEAIDNTMRRVSLAYPEYDIDAGKRYGQSISGGAGVFEALRKKGLTGPDSIANFVDELGSALQSFDYNALLAMKDEDVAALSDAERERISLISDAIHFLTEYYARVYAGALGATPERLAQEMNSGLETVGLLDQRSTTDQFSVPMMQPTKHELELIRSMKVNGQSIVPKMK